MPFNASVPEWLNVVWLGIIEGITEFLPISSTGHLLIAQQWIPEQSELFNVVIQCGAVLAVLAVFYRRLGELAAKWRLPATRDYLFKMTAAFVLTGIGGLGLKKVGFKLDPHHFVPVAWATLLGGGVILLIEFFQRNRETSDDVTWPMALAVAGAQILAAACPGTSRSGASILFALALGLNRAKATEFSFLVGIPTMFAAGAYEIHHELKHAATGTAHWGLLLLGTVVSAITAFLVVKWLLRFVQTHTFVGFGWYRIIMGGLMLALALWR